jgi:catalase
MNRNATSRLLAACAMMALAAPGLARAADDDPVETQIVDALNKVWGVHPGFRANHAKGVVVEGSFTPAPGAAALSRAIIFKGPAIPVTIRFSDSGGLPTIPDGAPPANPHGMSIKFHLPDGQDTDMVINSLKLFPVATGADFRDLLLAVASSPPDAPHPTNVEKFVAAHPAVAAATGNLPTPDSFADEQYNGVNAFILINAAGTRQAVRYVALPEKLVHLSKEDAAKQPPNFLMDELPARLKTGKVTFQLKAQLAEPGDPTNDATKPWPDTRKLADLGTITIDKAVPDSADAQKALLFLPGLLTDGIEESDDPLIDVRDGAYAVSFQRRSQ